MAGLIVQASTAAGVILYSDTQYWMALVGLLIFGLVMLSVVSTWRFYGGFSEQVHERRSTYRPPSSPRFAADGKESFPRDYRYITQSSTVVPVDGLRRIQHTYTQHGGNIRVQYYCNEANIGGNYIDNIGFIGYPAPVHTTRGNGPELTSAYYVDGQLHSQTENGLTFG